MSNDLVLSDNQAFLQLIGQLATNPDVDVQKVSAILDLKVRMMKEAAEQAFNQAYARIIRVMPRVRKNGTAEYKNKDTGRMEKAFNFARWEDMDDVIRPILLEEGFDLTFDMQPKEGGGAIVTGKLSHIMGHSRTSHIPLALDNSGGKNNIQGMGSTLSYGKRYVTEMLLNIVREGDDDDGERGGMTYVSAEQVEKLEALIAETKSDRWKFMEHFEITDLENMQEKDFVRAANMLVTKKAKQQKGSV